MSWEMYTAPVRKMGPTKVEPSEIVPRKVKLCPATLGLSHTHLFVDTDAIFRPLCCFGITLSYL